jgi:hypothetical protein
MSIGIMGDDRTDRHQFIDFVPSQCSLCRHYGTTSGPVPVCKAFPNVIPGEILLNHADHRKPYPGDDLGMGEPGEHVVFEPIEGTPEDVLARLNEALDQLGGNSSS